MKPRNLENKSYYFLISILTLAVLLLFLLSMSLQGEVLKEDKPLKGEAAFRLQELWRVEEGEGNPFGTIRSILVSSDGILCCLDGKLNRFFLYDRNGRLIRGFGKQGEGPGEIKLFRLASMYNAGEMIAVQDTDRIHYFDWEGKFLESFPNPGPRSPIRFLDRYRFITAHRNILATPDGIARVREVDLRTGKEKEITSFSIYKGGAISDRNSQAAIIAGGLTPLFELGTHRDRLYFGVSDKYEIGISDMSGTVFDRFGLKRQKRRVTEEQKVEPIVRNARGLAPEELLRSLAKKLPDEETYFTDIQSHGGMIWVFVSDWNRGPSKQIDIFSPEGVYLYRRFVRVAPGEAIISNPLVQGESIYLVIQDEEDEYRVARYRFDPPR